MRCRDATHLDPLELRQGSGCGCKCVGEVSRLVVLGSDILVILQLHHQVSSHGKRSKSLGERDQAPQHRDGRIFDLLAGWQVRYDGLLSLMRGGSVLMER
jgi:hypothetical protein